MKNFAESIKFYRDIPRNAFGVFRAEINSTNRRLLKCASAIVMSVTAVMFAVSFFLSQIADSRFYYLGMTLISAVVFFFSSVVLPENKRLTPIVSYTYFFAMLTAVMIIETYLWRGSNAAILCVIIAICPIFLLDKPWHTNCMLILITAIWCRISFLIKPADIAVIDCLNAIISCIIGIVNSYYFTGIKMHEFIRSRQLTLQRDSDGLTGIFNRNAGERRIREALCAEDTTSAMMLIDIDNFKRVNDTFGHMTGDKLLISVAQTLTKLFRKDDIICRLGGDEFMVLITEIPSISLALEKARQTVDSVTKITFADDLKVNPSVSIGISVSHKKSSYDSLYKAADAALYVVKESGRNGYRLNEEVFDFIDPDSPDKI